MNKKITNVPGRLHNVAVDEHGNQEPLTGANEIMDDALGKMQSEINAEQIEKNSQTDVAIQTEAARAGSEEATLRAQIAATQKQDVVPVETLPAVATADPKKIYRVVGETSYTDHMVNTAGTGWQLLGTFVFPGIDDVPTYGSNNLVKSGDVSKILSNIKTNDILDWFLGGFQNNTEFVNGELVVTQTQVADNFVNFSYAPFRSAKFAVRIIGRTSAGSQLMYAGLRNKDAVLFGFTKRFTLSEKNQEIILYGFNWDVDDTTPIFSLTIKGADAVIGKQIIISKIEIIPESYDMLWNKQPVPVDEILASKYINTDGLISDAVAGYRVAKIHITNDGYYYINTPYQLSSLSFVQYTDNTYSTVKSIIATTKVNGTLDLSTGYYAIGWYRAYNQDYIDARADFDIYKIENYNRYMSNNGAAVKTATSKDIEKSFVGNILQIFSLFNATAEQDVDGVVTMHQDSVINQCISFGYIPKIDHEFTIRFVAKCMTGTQKVRVGLFSSQAADQDYYKDIILTAEKQTFYVNNAKWNNVPYSIGILSSDVNVGNDIIIYSAELIIGNGITGKIPPITFNTDSFLQSVSRKDKYLVKIACAGDSLTANAVGGSIPASLDEGNTMRPIRMDYNNIPRRLYDYMSWNKPIWRRLDNSAWTKNGFSSVNVNLNGVPIIYHKATSQGSYAEIVVPNGYEHFALVARTKGGHGKLNVTIDGVTPSSITYKNPVLLNNPGRTESELVSLIQSNNVCTESVCPINIPCGNNVIDLNKGNSTWGNYFAVFEYNNLPQGQNNTIRFTADSATEVDIWGGFYWTGNTMVIMNIAHGGYDTSMLINQTLTDELYNADYDAVLFEVTEMNNMRLSLEQTEKDLVSIINNLDAKGIDRCFTSCNMLGMSIIYDVNFYNTDGNGVAYVRTQEQINDVVKRIMLNNAEPFVDLFQYFRWHVENRGGSLTGGQGGLWYSWDGQHPNIEGCALWVDALKKIIANTPIMIE